MCGTRTENLCFGLKHRISKKNIYRDVSRIPTFDTLPPVTLVKQLKAVRKESQRAQLRCCRVR